MILIIRHKSADREFQIQLDKNNLNYLYQPVLKFKYIKKKITNFDKKIFIVASIQAVRSIHTHNREYLNQIKGSQLFVIGNLKLIKFLTLNLEHLHLNQKSIFLY